MYGVRPKMMKLGKKKDNCVDDEGILNVNKVFQTEILLASAF